MLAELGNKLSVTRAALSISGRTKTKCPSVARVASGAIIRVTKRKNPMQRMPYISIRAFAVLALVLSASAQQNKEPVDYVNPNIGGIGQTLSATSPNVIMPYGRDAYRSEYHAGNG